MNKGKKIMVSVMLVAILLMAVGYAALSNVTLTIGGTASAIGNDANFKVWFSGNNTKTSGDDATAEVIAESKTATVNISNLMVVDEEKYVILEIVNESQDIDAKSVKVTPTNFGSTEFIAINAVMCDENGVALQGTEAGLAVNGKTYVKVSAKLLKTITSAETATINVEIVAVPEELN